MHGAAWGGEFSDNGKNQQPGWRDFVFAIVVLAVVIWVIWRF